jgi:hypothetical protein
VGCWGLGVTCEGPWFQGERARIQGSGFRVKG